jgi:hypothetical protein
MCRVFEMSRSGYYRWLKRKPSRRELDNQIREIYESSRHRYPVSANILSRNFTAEALDKVWVSDITSLFRFYEL